MFKAIRIGVLLLILFFVATNAWLTKARSTDWDNSLWVKIYPINVDGSDATSRYIERLELRNFEEIEEFVAREAKRYGKEIARPVRIELGHTINEQPPQLGEQPSMISVMLWSMKMRWWVGSVTDEQDNIEPDVSIFVRYHRADDMPTLENSVGVQKGMFGIVNAYTGRRYSGRNNVIIAHEFFHTIGATDKYEIGTGQPLAPYGLAEPGRKPLYPQRYAEIMGGRVALAPDDAVIPKNLTFAVIGPLTANEINLTD
ncbi:MAG: hypothetical protein OER97_00125 [Gammaproteobacteria bacterium]|nr:hypothetical protein [Gammaproteobacteria bacterium]